MEPETVPEPTDPLVWIVLAIVFAIPAIIVARFVVFMILPKSWLRKWFSG